MEKRKPHYELEAIKQQFRDPDGFRITTSAQGFAFEVLEIDREGLLSLIEEVRQEHFYKSMTSMGDHRIWQDVYHVPYGRWALYVKFTKGQDGFYLLISLKEK